MKKFRILKIVLISIGGIFALLLSFVGGFLIFASATTLQVKDVEPKKRDELFDEIKEKALAWSVGMSDPQRIDEINILQATYEAMRKAIAGLGVKPDILLNDFVVIPDIDIKQVGITGGDAKSVSIAAASILAKVTRDRLMDEYDAQYPEYGFAKHKGYGTKEHIAAIRELGPSEIHRMSFLRGILS